MTPRSIRRAAERHANKLARKAEKLNGLSTTASEAQLTANRDNAQLSTGPVTAAGKAKSSLNAVKTALTGRTVLLPTDDAAFYQAHVQRYEDHFQPVGPEEESLVQSIADTNWRLTRIPSLEMAIYAQGRIEFADAVAEEFADEDESVRPALIEARTYLAYEKQIRNLNLQESRLVRRREKETAELRRIQEERKGDERKAKERQITQTLAIDRSAPQPAAGIGFDFANSESEPFARRQREEIRESTDIPAAAA